MFQHHESTPIFPAASDAMSRAAVPTQYATAHGQHQRRLLLKVTRLGVAAVAVMVPLIMWLSTKVDGDKLLAGAAPPVAGVLGAVALICAGMLSMYLRQSLGLYVTADEVQVAGLLRRYCVPRSPSGESVLKLRSNAGGGHTLRLREKGPVIPGILHLSAEALRTTGQFTRFPEDNHLLVRTGDGEWAETGKVLTDDNVAEMTAWLSSPAAARFRPTA